MAGQSNTHVCYHPRRALRTKEANEQTEARSKRSDAEQLKLIGKRPGNSSRELERLKNKRNPNGKTEQA